MAPPPPANKPLGERLLQVAQTLQFAWFVGHVLLLIFAIRYGLSYITFNYYSKTAIFSYRAAFVSAAATYGIVVFKAFRARARAGKAQAPAAIAADENVQYLGMAILWLFSRQIPLAILPFAVYSIFHVATYTRSNLLPTINPQPATANGTGPSGGISDTIGRFVKEYYDASMTIVAILEIGLFFRLIFSAILFQKGSWILLIAYTVFFRVRHSQSSFMQNAITQLTARADAQFANQSTPPAVRQGWESAKGVVRSIADATDVNRFVRQANAAPKKAQ